MPSARCVRVCRGSFFIPRYIARYMELSSRQVLVANALALFDLEIVSRVIDA